MMALNIKQEKFIQNIVKGMSQREAYKDAYNAKYKDEVIDVRACELFNSSKVQVRYKEIMVQLEDKTIMSAKERMKWLTEVVKGIQTNTTYGENGQEYENEAYISDKMKAIDLLNKMDGQYVQRFEADLDFNIRVELDD